MRSVVTDAVVVLLVTSKSGDLSAVIYLTPRIKVTSVTVVWRGSSDLLRLRSYLGSIDVVTIKLSVARFEKAVGHDSLNIKVADVGNRFANAQWFLEVQK